MKKNIILISTLMLICYSKKTHAQSLKPKDIIVSTLLADNFSGRYNLGFEYFFSRKNPLNDSINFSLFLNGGITSTKILAQHINGFDFTAEANFYGEVLMSKKWNEYGGIKVSYGNFKNKAQSNSNRNFYFVGLGTGIQPVIRKKITIKLSSDLGYIKNGLANTLLFVKRDEAFYTGFAILFNLGVGIKL